MGWLRAAVGVALIVAPGAPMRLARRVPDGADMLLMRTIGIRDLVLGLGCVAAARSDDVADVRHWSAAALASDSLDTVASFASFRSIGIRESWTAGLLSLAFVGGDLHARRAGSIDNEPGYLHRPGRRSVEVDRDLPGHLIRPGGSHP